MQNKRTYGYVDKIEPLITEKALKMSEDSYIAFKGPKGATKKDIENVITTLYKGSKVLKVTSSVVKGKIKKFKGKIGKRADYKKFFVKLDKPIDITTGIK